ncbi:hypothetical protein J2Z32_002131 [Paenibacillus turicensis]|uniref:Uncharacterized protein n=1 Tax=Paenibacillus turicensis TaxID=160487 RepID=A0ABS4FSE9_9BACL|nr:hypothetical protein [Paenibacillus turicensis]MBP1905501.1 hypothetical protein [Paenibacillus turicensis]
MTITVYQQVFVSGDKTRAHVTIVDSSGKVLGRRFTDYEAYPLAQIAADNTQFLLRVLKRSLSPKRVIYDCNVRGRYEYKANSGGFEGMLLSHPRIDEKDTPRIQWVEPSTEDEEEDTE